MIPYLYESNETAFTSNGIGRLVDAISCTVTEERNGVYELEMEYPITGALFDEIQNSRIIAAVPAEGKAKQPFRIYRIEKPLDGICTIYAEHISYQLSLIPVMPFKAESCAEALAGLKNNAVQTCPFSFWTNKGTTANYSVDYPRPIRELLGGSQGSILDVFGSGEYEFDKWLVKLYTHRGVDSGVTIRYAKNLTELNNDLDLTNVITGVCPFWRDMQSGELVTLPEKAVWVSTAADYPYKRTAVIDFTNEWQTKPTVAQLRQRAEKYIADNNIGAPKTSVTVSFVNLADVKGVSIGSPDAALVIDPGTVNGDTLENIDGSVDWSAATGATVTDDGNANVTIASSAFSATASGGDVTIPDNAVLSFVDDGYGNIIVVGVDSEATLTMEAHWEITYADYKVLERINLCDTITVIYDALGVNVTAEVVKTVYNVLLDRYDSIEIGEARTTLAQQVISIEQETQQAVISAGLYAQQVANTLEQYVDEQTSLLMGGQGGFIVFGHNADGQPEEMFIMDTADMATATNVIRLNKNGIGFSQNGISGPYTSAWTINGVFNADFIGAGQIDATLVKTGTMLADRILGGTMRLGGSGNVNGVLEIYNSRGDMIGSIDRTGAALTGEMVMLFLNAYGSIKSTIDRSSFLWVNPVAVETQMQNLDRPNYSIRLYETATTDSTATKMSWSGYQYPQETLTTKKAAYCRNVIISAPSASDIEDASTITSGYRFTELVSHISSNIYYDRVMRDIANQTLWSEVIGATRYTIANCGASITPSGQAGDWVIELASTGILIQSGIYSIALSYGVEKIDGKTIQFASSSSRRYKHSISPLDDNLDPHRLLDLPVRQFVYNEGHTLQYADMEGQTLPGFIAEDVDEHYPAAVIHDAEGNVESWDERRIIPGMLALIQEQDKHIKDLESRLERLEKHLEELMNDGR